MEMSSTCIFPAWIPGTVGARSAEDALKEIGYNISFLEDVPDEMLAPHLYLIDSVSERLNLLKEKLH
jgi:hypothetical protein